MAPHHPGWLKFLNFLVFVGVLYFCCSISFTYFNDVRAYLGVPIGFVGGYYISYYVYVFDEDRGPKMGPCSTILGMSP